MTAGWQCARRSTPSPRLGALRRRDGRTCRRNEIGCSCLYSLGVGSMVVRNGGAEQRHAADQLDLAIDEAGVQLALQVADVIVLVVDHAQAVEQRMYEHATDAIRDAVIHQRVTEDARAALGERSEPVEDSALVRQVAGEAVDDAAERDRVERAAVDVADRAQYIADV